MEATMPTPTAAFRAAARLLLVPMLWLLAPGDAAAGKILATLYAGVAGRATVEIDPLTGNYSELWPTSPPGATAEFTRSTYDAANNVVYAVNGNNYFSRIDVDTGAYTLVTLPSFKGQFPIINAFEFNPTNGKILATLSNLSGAAAVVEIDPQTGNFTELSPLIPPGSPSEFTRTTYDAANNIVYFVSGTNFFSGIDADTGAFTFVGLPDFHGDAPTIFGFEFNPNSGKILATLINDNADAVVEIDPLTGAFIELSTIVPMSGVTPEFVRTTFDAVNNVMYYLHDQNNFSAVDGATGAVTNFFVPAFNGHAPTVDVFEFVPGDLQAIPEPGSLGLAAMAACLLALAARRRRPAPA
jgi:hypothetical protein